MGRSSMPLRILVHPDLESLEEVQLLKDKGHLVSTGLTSSTTPGQNEETVWDCDLVLGPNAWRMTPLLVKYLPSAVKSSRAVKYPGRINPKPVRKELNNDRA